MPSAVNGLIIPFTAVGMQDHLWCLEMPSAVDGLIIPFTAVGICRNHLWCLEMPSAVNGLIGFLYETYEAKFVLVT